MVAGGHATIADNDQPLPPATVSVSASPTSVTEGDNTPAAFTLTFSRPLGSSGYIWYDLGGTASNGSDYVCQNGSVWVGGWESQVTIPVYFWYDDTAVEGNETITLTVQPPYNNDYQLDPSASSATIMIVDNDMAPTTAVLASSALTTVYQDWAGVTLTATVSPTVACPLMPTGTVQFYDGSTCLGDGSLDTSGTASLTVWDLAAGQHALYAVYQGDAHFVSSTSEALIQTIETAATTTFLDASSNPSVLGEAVEFIAYVLADEPSFGIPTGTMQFFADANYVGSAELDSSGMASWTTADMALGWHNLWAVYSGDSNFVGSTSATMSQEVGVDVPILRADGCATVVEGQDSTLSLLAAFQGSGAILNWHVAWGDGATETFQGNSAAHRYTAGSGLFEALVSAETNQGGAYAAPHAVVLAVLPAGPTALSATPAAGASGQMQLSWTANSQLTTGYRIEQSSDGSHYTFVATAAGYVSDYTISGLTASTHYDFRVCAVNDAGRSAYAYAGGATNAAGSGTVASQDDRPSELVDIGMNLNFYGSQFSQVWINNNGNITTAAGLDTYSPAAALATGYNACGAIIAPFFGDVDTRDDHGSVSYQATTIGGRPAWSVLWNGVDYFNVRGTDEFGEPDHASLSNTFSVTLVDRSDVTAGDFDIVFHYSGLAWDTGDASGGRDGLADPNALSSYPARAGYSNGSGLPGTWYEFDGSGEANGLLGLSGDHTFEVRNAAVGLTAYRTGGNYGAAVAEADERSGDPSNYVILVNDNYEQDATGTAADLDYNGQRIWQNEAVNVGDHDLARITLSRLQLPPQCSPYGTISVALSNPLSARLFDAAGHLLTADDLVATLGGSGYLAGLGNHDVDVYVEGIEADADFSLTYAYADSLGFAHASATVHMAIADISLVGADGEALSFLECSQDLSRMLDPDPATGGTYAVYNAIRPIQFKTRIAGLASAAIQGVAVISEAGGSYQDALTDRAGVVESAMFGVLVDTNGQSLTETERATIRALYSLNGIDARDTTFVQVTTAKDEQVRVVPGVKNKRWEEIKNYKVTERVTEIVDQLPGGGFGEAEFSGNAEFELGVRTRDGSPQIEWKTLVTPITMQAATIVGGVALKPEWIQATIDHEDVHVTKALQVAQSVDAVVRRLDADLQQVPAEARNARAHAVTQFLNTVGPKWFETRLALERIRQRFHFDHLTCQTRGVVGGVYTVHPETYQTVWNLRETQEAFLQVMKDPVLFPNSQVQTVDQGVEFLKTAIGKYDGEILAVMYNEAKAIMHKG